MLGLGLTVELVLFLWFVSSDEVKLVVGFNNMGDWVVMEGDQGGYIGEDMAGVSAIYDYGWWLVVVAGWALFVSVFVVIEITRGG